VSETWRVVINGPSAGVWNMAVDRAIQQARESGDVPPTLRLYSWHSPTLTLGRFQDAGSGLLGRCRSWGVEVARRPTGGRGVIHDDELTYSVVASISDGVPRGVSASYRHLCQGIVSAYRILGVGAELTGRDRGQRHESACYLHATAADVSAGVAKLSGSAQVWLGDTCLQHGSFTRSRDVGREGFLFGLSEEEAEELSSTTATLTDLLGRSPDLESVTRAAIDGFAEALGFEADIGELSRGELDAAHELVAEYELETPAGGSR
jgi:lipoate-protein ligase A